MKHSLHVFATFEESYANRSIFAYTHKVYDLPIVLKEQYCFSVSLRKNCTLSAVFLAPIQFDPQVLKIQSIVLTTEDPSEVVAPGIVNNEQGYVFFFPTQTVRKLCSERYRITFTIEARDMGESSITFPFPIRLEK